MCSCIFCSRNSYSNSGKCVKKQRKAPESPIPMQDVLGFDNNERNFKNSKTFQTRKEEVKNIRAKFPTKIPVVVERWGGESSLPLLNKSKFLVPQELTMSQFVNIIRSRMKIDDTQTFYLLVNNKSLVSLSRTLTEVYRECHDDDGFLYITYASQEVFGH